MTGTIAEIWRHPIKSHGVEALANAALEPGRTLPGDRLWAVHHEAAKLSGTDWAPCANFSRVAKAPALAAIRAQLHADEATVTLTHPDRPQLTFQPDQEGDFILRVHIERYSREQQQQMSAAGSKKQLTKVESIE